MFLSATGIRPMIARIAMVNLSAALGGTLLGIDHVGLAVRDLDEAIDRWSKTFGIEVSHREINESQGIEGPCSTWLMALAYNYWPQLILIQQSLNFSSEVAKECSNLHFE